MIPASGSPGSEARPGVTTTTARILLPAVVAGGLVVGPVVGMLAAGPHPALALVFPLALLPIIVWTRPQAGVLLVLVATVAVEQLDYQVAGRSGALTAKLPFFRAIIPGSGITALDGLLALTLIFWIMRSVQNKKRLFHASPLTSRLAWLAVMTLLYFALGVQRGGDVKAAIWEVKPLFYLTVLFFLASELLASARTVRIMMWIIIVGSGVKAAYGLLIFLSVRQVQPRPEAVLSHEESFFFGIAIFLTVGLWAFRLPSRLRVVATILLPFVLLGDMVNSRRTAWAILIFGGVLMTAIAYVRLPTQRKGLRRGMVVMIALSAVYLPVFWNNTGTTAQPARAVRSLVAPDARDQSSDEYRVLEDANLALNIRARHSTGSGYGVPIDYAVKIPDLTGISSMLAYVPHNGVLWIWMRLGLVGQIAFWLLIAEGVMAACRLTASRDRETALLGALVACALLAYVIIGQKDLGFFWFRINCCMGILLGALFAQSRAAATEPLSPVGTTMLRAQSLLRGSDS